MVVFVNIIEALAVGEIVTSPPTKNKMISLSSLKTGFFAFSSALLSEQDEGCKARG